MPKTLTFQCFGPILKQTEWMFDEMNCGKNMEREFDMIDKFRKMLLGEYDNSLQVKREEAEGHGIHPLAIHGIYDVTHLVQALPEDFRGIFVLEESHFHMGAHTVEKKYLFSYEEVSEGILLKSYQFPEGLLESGDRLSETDWMIPYEKLEESPRFQPLLLKWDGRCFVGENVSQFSPEHRFYFRLEVYTQEFYVKELLKKDHIVVAGYESPIHYLPRKEGAPCHC